METLTESALRILLPRRHVQGALRQVTRDLIHQDIRALRASRASRT